MDNNTSQSINNHYGRKGLKEAIISALKDAGKDLASMEIEDVLGFDQLHIGGRAATMKLAKAANLNGMEVLDVGSGIGGSARLLASEFGCTVTGLDMTREYNEIARLLTDAVGLSEQISFQHGNALHMPFEAKKFDVIWSQHASMNIPDKRRLFEEYHRVLRPGSQLLLHEVVSGEMQPIHFPVPWADNPSISFLSSTQRIKALLGIAGFKEMTFTDMTKASLAWWEARIPSAEKNRPKVTGAKLIFGSAGTQMGKNIVRNLQENRVHVIQAIMEKDK